MRVPVSWLRDYVDLSESVTGRDIAERLVSVGLEVETVDEIGAELTGPLLLGRVISFEEEEHSNGKTVRWCQVDVGEPEPRGIVCGARNFATNDLVVVALPGAVLPGGFKISARKTYGHLSDGMICSTLELGAGDDHEGIWTLPEGLGAPGDDAL
ncbi:MAG: phenylalanine--tRNA ligase subunit beta, partial [Actinomycetes bacterium]